MNLCDSTHFYIYASFGAKVTMSDCEPQNATSMQRWRVDALLCSSPTKYIVFLHCRFQFLLNHVLYDL